MSFSRYYHEELSYIREKVQEFVKKYPDKESILGEYGGDAGVEHLLQSFSFLTARIRENIDGEVPEVIHQACRIVAPQYLRTFPSCSVVEYKPDFMVNKGRTRIQQGTELISDPVEGTECRFRTVWPLDIAPLEVEDVLFDNPMSAKPILRVQLRTNEVVDESLFDARGIRFFLHGPREVTTNLMYWMNEHFIGASVRSLDVPGPNCSLAGQYSFYQVGWNNEEALFPWSPDIPEAYRMLLEYYIFPEKFLFFDLLSLDLGRSEVTKRFEVRFKFEKPMDFASKITKDTLRLNCVPVINLFEEEGKPIQYQEEKDEYLVQAECLSPEHAEVFHIRGVEGKSRPDAPVVEYEPFCSVKQGGTKRSGPLYHERREFSPIGDLDVYIKPHGAQKNEIFTLDLLCTNRALAGRVQAGDLRGNDKGSTEITYKNIIKASRPVLPSLDKGLWSLLGHPSSHYVIFSEIKNVKDILNDYNFHGSTDEIIGEANRRRVDALISIETSKTRSMVQKALRLGTRSLIQVREEGFVSHGDAYLFGRVLGKILATPYTQRSFHKLVLILQPSNILIEYPSELGTRQLM